jgi:nitrous oxidase accessory protein
MRAMFFVASVLTSLALVLPLWEFRMSAPQYPDEALHVRVTRSGLAGDLQEVGTLQKYIGVRFPASLPELDLLVPGVAVLAAWLLLAACSGAGRFGHLMRASATCALLALLVCSLVVVQKRLYVVGHERDPNAPMARMKDFTPLVIGPTRVGNFTVWSYPHLGGFALALAAGLALAGMSRSNSRWIRRLERGRLSEAPGVSRPFVAALVSALVLSGAVADARTWTVGGAGANFPLITPAIGAAAAGDTIVVRRGVYREDLVLDRPVTLRGEGHPVLIGTGAGTVVEIRSSGVEVRGFIIEGSGTGLTNRMDAAVHLAGNGNRVSGNLMRRVFYGVVIIGAAGNEVSDNTIEGFEALPFGQRGDGVYVFRAPDTRVLRNQIGGMRDGIYFQYAPRGVAAANVVERSRYGLHDMFSDGARIEANTFRRSSVGATIMNSTGIAVRGNRIERNRGISSVGLTLKQCDDSLVEGNVIAGNARGLLVEGSFTNRFVGNRFVFNDTAVSLFSSAEQNVFTSNVFDGNWSDVVVSGGGSDTRWSENGRGNQWSRYRGFDFDGDGVGDSPHSLLGVFEKLEGHQPAVRLFLHSPSAHALELAARLGTTSRRQVSDPFPLTARASAGEGERPVRPRILSLLVMTAAGLCFTGSRSGG